MKNKLIEKLKKAIAAAPVDPNTGAVSPALANYCDCLYTELARGVSVNKAHSKCKALGIDSLYSPNMCRNVEYMTKLGICRLICNRDLQQGTPEYNKCVQKCMTKIDNIVPTLS
jgi:hypothetical protein